MAGDSELEQLKKVARLQGYVRGQQATITKLEQKLATCRALLREACEHPGFPSAEWYVAARAAGGGSE